MVEQKFAGKILIITAYDTSDYIRQALTLGVTDYLLKPVAAKELKEAIDKCMELLRRDKEQREKEISSSIVSCYAEQYLVSDIMKGRYPKLTLEEAYHWEKNGRLNVYVAGIAGRDVPEIFKDTDTAGIWSKYFWTVCGKVEEVTFLFLHPRLWVEQSELIVILQTGMKILSRKIKEGRIVVSIPAATYEQLGEICDRIVRTIKKKKEGVWMEPTAWENETDRVNGKKLCRKYGGEQRLRENNAENFTRMFRRKAQETKQYWGCVSVLFDAICALDHSADLLELLELLQGEKPYGKLEKWLKKQNKESAAKHNTEEKNKILFAVAWMKRHFSEDISRAAVSAELGLNETYFSHLFKQETGQSFVRVLTEIRMEHAKEMLDAGVSDADEIARACGYYSKKYFLEVFKRFTGYRITDYQREGNHEKAIYTTDDALHDRNNFSNDASISTPGSIQQQQNDNAAE